MGVLGDLVGHLVSGDGRSGKQARALARLASDGERLPATIDALKIVDRSDSTAHYFVGVRVRGAHGEFRAAVEQVLQPHPELARLGTAVTVLHLDGAIAIDWPEALRRMGAAEPGDGGEILSAKTLKKSLPPGIDDNRLDTKRLASGVRTTGELVSAERFELMGLATENWNLGLRLADGRDVQVKRSFVPPYARHLVVVGATLPVAVDAKKPEKVSVDWAGAAEAAAG